MTTVNKIQELRARIASGAVRPTSTKTPRVGEGLFECLVTEASFGKGESGNARGLVKLKVLSGGTDAEVGGMFNLYVQVKNEKYLESTIAEWAVVLAAHGVTEDRIYEDAETLVEVATNIMALANKLAQKGKLKLTIKRKAQEKPDAKGKTIYYNDIVPASAPVDPFAETEPEPEAEAEPEMVAEVETETEVPMAPKKKVWE